MLEKLFNPASLHTDKPYRRFFQSLIGGRTIAGPVVNHETVLGISAVFSATRIISRHIGLIPIYVYDDTDEGRQKVRSHRNNVLLNYTPNPEMKASSVKECIQAYALLQGNGYAEIQRNMLGQAVALWPLNSYMVTPFRDEDGNLMYAVQNDAGGFNYLQPSDILHIAEMGDGLCGLSRIKLARESMGLTIAAEQFGGALFGNGANTSGVLEIPGKLSDQSYERLREDWNNRHSGGPDKAHRLAILESGMKYNQTSIAPDDAQFLETRSFQVTEVARWFNIPPHKLGHLENSSLNNIEHQSIEYIQDTLNPWITQWEQECKNKLFSRREANLYIDFDTRFLSRGDLKTSVEALTKGIDRGIFSIDESREFVGLPKIEFGETRLAPLNMTTLERLAANPPDPKQETPEAMDQFRDLVISNAHRVLKRVSADVNKAIKKGNNSDIVTALDRVRGTSPDSLFVKTAAAYYTLSGKKSSALVLFHHLIGYYYDKQNAAVEVVEITDAELTELVDNDGN